MIAGGRVECQVDIKRYEDMDSLDLDVIKEVGSIGTGSAATALSGLLDTKIQMTIPDVGVKAFDDAVNFLGSPEEPVAAVLVQMSGDMNGLMLFLLEIDFINEVTRNMLGKTIEDYSELSEMEISALTEVGNIMISTYVSALTRLAGLDVSLSVPAVSVNMLGGVLSVPMIEFGYETDKLLIITGKFIIEGKKLNSNLLMLPDIPSLNLLIKKLVIADG